MKLGYEMKKPYLQKIAKAIEEEFERSVQGQIQKVTSLGPELRFGFMTDRFEENDITRQRCTYARVSTYRDPSLDKWCLEASRSVYDVSPRNGGWSLIAGRLPGRTSNHVKNYWSTRLRKNKSSRAENDKTLETTKTVILRPQPRTFSKKSYHLSSPAPTLQYIQLKENFNWPLPSSPPIENGIDEWKSQLADTNSVERAMCSGFQLEEDFFANFWVENIAQNTGTGVNSADEGLLSNSDFSSHLWNFSKEK
ncbi:hypothetical protein GBA52_020185 [Prunus armeniaca]|nr:hypothetical protein GBA52_020185 [Prunus armeniaca]